MRPPTPYLAIDEAVLQRNIESTAAWAAGRGVALRPHVKTHKIPEIARRQVAAGALGITVATIAEAEVFVAAGFDDVFIAYPLWLDENKRARLAALVDRARVSVGVDSLAAGRLLPARVSVLVEVDSGHHRTGVEPAAAGSLAADLAELGHDVAGLFTFPGHSYAPGAGRAAAAVAESSALAVGREAFRAAGLEPRVISGGSTPSLAESGLVASELRPGVYVVNDAQQWELGTCTAEDLALTCHATVVSHAGGRAVLDCGSKILGADRAPWASGYGRLLDDAEARIVMLSEHHAVVETAHLPALGSVVRVVPNHACNALNLVDRVELSTTGTWPVAARGCNA